MCLFFVSFKFKLTIGAYFIVGVIKIITGKCYFCSSVGKGKLLKQYSFIEFSLTHVQRSRHGVNNVRCCFRRSYITMWTVLWKWLFIMRVAKKGWEKTDCGVLETATCLTLKQIQILWGSPSFSRLKYALLLLLCYLASYTGAPDHFSKVNWGCA